VDTAAAVGEACSEMQGYGQFCPIAQAAEVLTERWTPLVIRELVAGSHRFNDIQRGVPLMSASLLTKRLRSLEGAGVIERRPREHGPGHEYHLTAAGAELAPIVELMGVWGERWLQRTLTAENTDVALLMWAIRRSVHADAVPPGRSVVHFRFPPVPEAKRSWWLVLEAPAVDLCLTDPGFGTDLTIRGDPATMARVWLGEVGLAAALSARAIVLEGPEHLVRSFPRWFGLSAFADVARRYDARALATTGVPTPRGTS
jgi:DNA-binding HxlR family transcriptional regulator